MLGGNFKSESIGGAPVAPLMGRATYDGAQTLCTFSPLTTFVVNPDYAVVYNFIPRNATRTDIQAIWMVTSTAIEGTDYDISRVTAVWDATLSEDKALVQNNQSGVESGRYRPGRYSRLELGVSDFDRWYIDHVATRTSQSAAAP
jgi:Rieske 2Fe-2S family protein